MIYFFGADGACLSMTTMTHHIPEIRQMLMDTQMANLGAANYVETDQVYDFEAIYFAGGEILQFSAKELAAKKSLRAGFVWRMPQRILEDSRTLPQMRAEKIAEVAAKCATTLAPIKDGYPEGEQQTWTKQEDEARAYKADPNSSTPLLAALAIARGVTIADLSGRVIAKADTFAAVSGALIGKRQRLEDEAMAASTPEAIAAVDWGPA
jgi:hypothetical protein